MPRWIHRLLNSRRAGIGMAAASGLIATAGCGGALLANFTVAGMDRAFYARPQTQITMTAPASPGWGEQAMMNVVADSPLQPSQASYLPESAATEYAIGD